jgi:hypothetical protein
MDLNNKQLTKYVYSFAMGDGTIEVDHRDWNKNGNAWFSESKVSKNLDFLEFAGDILSNITAVTIKPVPGREEVQDAEICGVKCVVKPQHRIRTSRHPFFNTFRERLYSTGKKVIDPHYLTLLDWEMMAILFMDDGSHWYSYPHGHKEPGMEIATHRYSYADNLILKQAIKEKLGVEFNVKERRSGGNLYYFLKPRVKDIAPFLDGVGPYILPSFEYKLNPKIRTNDSEKSDDDIV